MLQAVDDSFTAMDDGRWMCRLCCAILTTKKTARNHVKTIHLKEKNYACQHCAKRFGDFGNARKHEKKCSAKLQ